MIISKFKIFIRIIIYIDYYILKWFVDTFGVFNKFKNYIGIIKYKLRMKPWSVGYSEFKEFEIVKNMLSEQGDKPFGKTIDERIVELPWVVKKMQGKDLILDAGSALNHSYVLPYLKNSKVSIVTLYPETFKSKGNESYIYSDLRNLYFKDKTFDAIACISTIEHIGFNNDHYNTSCNLTRNDTESGGREKVVLELKRVLKDAGILCISGPYGLGEDNEKFRNLNYDDVYDLVNVFKPNAFILVTYLYTSDGWIRKDPNDPCFCDIKYRSNNSAAAGAVFLLELKK
jgi:SAM-dependent methyltransferase